MKLKLLLIVCLLGINLNAFGKGIDCLKYYKKKEALKIAKVVSVVGIGALTIVGGVVAAPLAAAAVGTALASVSSELALVGISVASITSGVSTGVLATGATVGGVTVLTQADDTYEAFAYAKMIRLIKQSRKFVAGEYAQSETLPGFLTKFSEKRCKKTVEEVAPEVEKASFGIFCIDKKHPWKIGLVEKYLRKVIFDEEL